jgi:hypothetical protein
MLPYATVWSRLLARVPIEESSTFSRSCYTIAHCHSIPLFLNVKGLGHLNGLQSLGHKGSDFGGGRREGCFFEIHHFGLQVIFEKRLGERRNSDNTTFHDYENNLIDAQESNYENHSSKPQSSTVDVSRGWIRSINIDAPLH